MWSYVLAALGASRSAFPNRGALPACVAATPEAALPRRRGSGSGLAPRASFFAAVPRRLSTMLGASSILASPMRAASARSSVTSVANLAQREAERVQLVCLVTLTLIAVRPRNAQRLRGSWAQRLLRCGARARCAILARPASRVPPGRGGARARALRRAACAAKRVAGASRSNDPASPPHAPRRRAPPRCTGWSRSWCRSCWRCCCRTALVPSSSWQSVGRGSHTGAGRPRRAPPLPRSTPARHAASRCAAERRRARERSGAARLRLFSPLRRFVRSSAAWL